MVQATLMDRVASRTTSRVGSELGNLEATLYSLIHCNQQHTLAALEIQQCTRHGLCVIMLPILILQTPLQRL
jgi:hypothetical protein